MNGPPIDVRIGPDSAISANNGGAADDTSRLHGRLVANLDPSLHSCAFLDGPLDFPFDVVNKEAVRL